MALMKKTWQNASFVKESKSGPKKKKIDKKCGWKKKYYKREKEIVGADEISSWKEKYKKLPDEQESKNKTSEWTVKIIIKLVQLWWSLFDFFWKLSYEKAGDSGDDANDDYLEK